MPRGGRKHLPGAVDTQTLRQVIGRWKVVEALYTDSSSEEGSDPPVELDLNGVELGLDDQFDVSWKLPAQCSARVKQLPVLQTTSFANDPGTIEFLGAPSGQSFVFMVLQEGDRLCLSSDLGNEDTLTIVLRKVGEVCEPSYFFSLRAALEEGFFSDLTIKSSDGQKFCVHKAVLCACCRSISYREWEIFLGSLPVDQCKAALSFVYVSCLPRSLDLSVAKGLMAAASQNPKMKKLSEMCKAFIENHNLKKYLTELVDEIHERIKSAHRIVEVTSMKDPTKVMYAMKQLAREAATVITQFCLLCELYSRNRREMSSSERHEVLEYVRGRVVVFIDQAKELLELVLAKWNDLSTAQKEELIQYCISDVEHLWEVLIQAIGEVDSVSYEIKSDMERKPPPQRAYDVTLPVLFHYVTHRKEAKRMQKVFKEFEEFASIVKPKREQFVELSEEEQVEKIFKVVQEMASDGEVACERLEKTKRKILMSNALEWKKYKVAVDLICSHVTWGLGKLSAIVPTLKPTLLKACKFVDATVVWDSLVYVGLLEEKDLPQRDDPNPAHLPHAIQGVEPTSAKDSELALGCQRLLDSQEHADLEFVIGGGGVGEGGEEREGGGRGGGEEGVHKIMAHRVIVAARCEWFKRALLSGMKEAIDRRIVIPDVELGLFKKFLQFLYGAAMDTAEMEVEELVEIMALADRYETGSLRSVCEVTLVQRVCEQNVFSLLEVADHYSARHLREACLRFVMEHQDILMTQIDGYSNLPHSLKEEIRNLLSVPRHHSHTPILSQVEPPTCTATKPIVSDGVRSEEEEGEGEEEEEEVEGGKGTPRAAVDVGRGGGGRRGEDDSLDHALGEMRAVVGEDALEEVLRECLLAADLDINRAINYYLNTYMQET